MSKGITKLVGNFSITRERHVKGKETWFCSQDRGPFLESPETFRAFFRVS